MPGVYGRARAVVAGNIVITIYPAYFGIGGGGVKACRLVCRSIANITEQLGLVTTGTGKPRCLPTPHSCARQLFVFVTLLCQGAAFRLRTVLLLLG
jgi:hypothetical protein